MRRFVKFGQRLPLWVVVIVPLLVFALACGPGEEATPTPTTTAPTPTSEGPVATPTPTTEAPPVATVGPQRGGTFRWAHWVSPPNFDPHTTGWQFQGWSTQPVSNNILFNPGGEVIICEICVNDAYTLENAGKTMVFKLRQGIKFSDGKEMTSADVVWSLRKIMGEVDGVVSPRCGPIKEYIESIEAPSRYEVRLNLLRPSPAFVPKVLQYPMCSIVQDGKTRSDLLSWDQLIGTGAYILKEYLPKATHTFERNPNYFKPGLPYFDEVILYWASDQTAEMLAFMSNRLDWWNPGASTVWVAYEREMERLRGEGKIGWLQGIAPPNSGIYFNHSRPPFNDLKMRQAVNLAIDRKAWSATLDGGYITYVFFPSDSFGNWGRPESEIWDVLPGWGTGAKKATEIQQAKQLVIDAGYPSGVEAEYVARAPNEFGIEILKGIGIRTKVRQVATTAEQDQTITNLQYDYAVSGLGQVTRDPDEWFLSYWLTGGARNWYGYSNPEFDRLAVQQSSELDPVKRKVLVRQASDLLLEDVAVAFRPGGVTREHWWNYLNWPAKGVGYLVPYAGTTMYRFEDWWFDESAR